MLTQHKYRPTFPVQTDNLPNGVRWHYLEAPPGKVDNMPGLPRSKHVFGLIGIDRELSELECKHANLEPHYL